MEMSLHALALVLIACISSVFGLVGVLAGIRLVRRDVAILEDVLADRAKLRTEWSATLEGLEGTLEALDRTRRRTAASASRLAAVERGNGPAVEAAAPVPMTREQELAAARARLRQRGV